MDVTVVIGTYGDEKFWRQLAQRRAMWSAVASGAVHVLHEHGETLAKARNAGLARVETEWVCFLDADDELEPGYLEAMATGSADLRAPAVRYVPWGYLSGKQPVGRPARVPRVVGHHHDCTAECLAYGNWLVIGSLVRAALVREVGGFEEWPVYEDFDLWARCWQAGATAESIPEAVYRAHVRSNSRNRGSMSARAKHGVHQDIARSLGLPVPA